MDNKYYSVPKDYEEELDLVQIGIYILKRWRIIVLVALLGAICAGGYKFVSTVVTNEDMKNNTSQMAIDEYNKKIENDVDAYEAYLQTLKFYNTHLANLNKQLADQTEYIQESKIMNINPLNEMRGHKEYFVKLDDSLLEKSTEAWDPADSIGMIYCNTINEEMDMMNISKLYGTETIYANELVEAVYDLDANILAINVIGEDEQTVKAVLEEIDGCLISKEKSVVSTVGKHELSQINNSIDSVRDDDLYNRILNYNLSIGELTESMVAEEKYLSSLKLPTNTESEVAYVVASPIKNTVKFAFIGFIGLLFAAVACYGMVYILNRVIRTRSDLEERYGITLLGSCKKNADKNGKVDQLIHAMDKDDVENGQAIILEMIDYHAKQNQFKNVLLVADVQNSNLDAIKQNYLPELQEKGYDSAVVNDVSQSKEALVQLENCDGVVIFVERGFTKLDNCDELFKILGHYKKPVIGYVTY